MSNEVKPVRGMNLEDYMKNVLTINESEKKQPVRKLSKPLPPVPKKLVALSEALKSVPPLDLNNGNIK